MPDKPPTLRAPGARNHAEAERAYEARRRERDQWRAWYKLPLWAAPRYGLRAQQLARQPLCENCLAMTPPRMTVATVVHHKVPHRGDWALFIDPANHASACKVHHDRELQRLERAASKGEVRLAGPRG